LDYPAQQADFISAKEDGTGQWFLDSSHFIAWQDTPKSTLFCPGIPGAGKTMLAAITIDHLSHAKAGTDVGLAYLYCNYKSEAIVDGLGFLAALLKQLVHSRRAVDVHIAKLFGCGESKPTWKDVSAAMKATLKLLFPTYIVVDALDECPNQDGTRSRLLRELKSFQRDADVRLMFTSRFDVDFQLEFGPSPTLEVRASDADVKRYVQGQIHRLPRCVRRDPHLQAVVESKIASAVGGM
jgi:hypothetical protein